MNCVDFVCGTGGWRGPKPGDPDIHDPGTISLNAVPAFGGIQLSWSYPIVNPYAVAYTLIYRGVNSSFNSAIELARVAGNRYLDPLELTDEKLYYYWIKMVSVNGTEGALVGPVSCQMRSTIGGIIDELSGKINEGVLHRALLEKIDRIQMLGNGLADESQAREQDILAMSRVVDELRNTVQGNTAAINTVRTTWISTVDALASQLTTLEAQFGDNIGILQQELGILASEHQITAREVSVAKVTAEEALAAFRSERTARIEAIDNLKSVIASDISTVESELNGNLAQARTVLQTNINTVNGKVTAIGARYTVQVQANGLAGGFGVYNDGKTVDAGFIADRFWIGSTASNKKKPFIVQNGTVFIDTAMIANASITDAKISNAGIDFAKIKNVHITDAHITNGSIDFAKIKNVSIDKANIRNLKVGTLEIEEGAASIIAIGETDFYIDTRPSGASVTLIYILSEVPETHFTEPSWYRATGTATVAELITTSIRIPYVTGGNPSSNEGMGTPLTYGFKSIPGMNAAWLNSDLHLIRMDSPGVAIAIVSKR